MKLILQLSLKRRPNITCIFCTSCTGHLRHSLKIKFAICQELCTMRQSEVILTLPRRCVFICSLCRRPHQSQDSDGFGVCRGRLAICWHKDKPQKAPIGAASQEVLSRHSSGKFYLTWKYPFCVSLIRMRVKQRSPD